MEESGFEKARGQDRPPTQGQPPARANRKEGGGIEDGCPDGGIGLDLPSVRLPPCHVCMRCSREVLSDVTEHSLNVLSAESPSAVVVLTRKPGQCAVLSRDGALVSTSGCIQDVNFSYRQRAHQPGVNHCAKHLSQENVMFI